MDVVVVVKIAVKEIREVYKFLTIISNLNTGFTKVHKITPLDVPNPTQN